MSRLGIISDTHGLLRPDAKENLKGVEMILHIGDVGKASILEELERIAPTVAVRGNIDKGPWAENLSMTEVVEWQGKFLYMIHILEELDIDPKAAGMDIVLFGHSHKPFHEIQDGVQYFNPGSAGPRRFSLPISMGTIEIQKGSLHPQLIHLAA